MIAYDPHRWFEHFFDVRGSLLPEILWRMSACVVWSAAVVWCDVNVRSVGVASTLHGLIGLALGLLLVFRTNSSYDRFWEGRRLWGGIVNECRNLCRAAEPFLAAHPPRLQELTAWVTAFPFAVKGHLRGMEDDVDGRLAAVRDARHRPLAVARAISGRLHDARTAGLWSDYVQMQLDQNVQLLMQYCGGCERIHNTPIPFAYVVHLRRALLLYCYTLPFALVEAYGWWTVLDVFVLTFIFFGIEEIGVEIEDPFGSDANDLAVDAYCQTIATNLEEIAPPARRAAAPGGVTVAG